MGDMLDDEAYDIITGIVYSWTKTNSLPTTWLEYEQELTSSGVDLKSLDLSDGQLTEIMHNISGIKLKPDNRQGGGKHPRTRRKSKLYKSKLRKSKLRKSKLRKSKKRKTKSKSKKRKTKSKKRSYTRS